MTWFYLIRHGSHDWLSKGIAGWQKGIHLNDLGRIEVDRLAAALERCSIKFLYSSPLDRTMETANILADRLHLQPVHASEELGEVHYGDWDGLTFQQLESIPGWERYNTARSLHRISNGESAIELQQRIVNEILRLNELHRGRKIGIVSHGDPLRAAILYFLGMPLDLIYRIEISPASVSLLKLENDFARIQYLNYLPEPV